jgi:ElaB/YqjD/DUF883 family membrane-anchored ribosome-binding protein
METTARSDYPFPKNDVASATDGALNRAASNAHAAVDKAASGANAIANKAADATGEALRNAKPAIDRAAGTAHQTVDKAASAANSAASWAQDQAKNLSVTGQQVLDDTRSYVAANPVKTVAVVLGAGFLLGRLMGLFTSRD